MTRKSNADDAQSEPAEGDGRFAYDGLDRVIHEKARLGILTSLSAHPEGLLFNDLKQLCALTDGNLNRHLAVLVESGLVEVWKSASTQPRTQTLYRLTVLGQQRFLEYVNVLEQVVRDAAAARDAANQAAARVRLGWSGN